MFNKGSPLAVLAAGPYCIASGLFYLKAILLKSSGLVPWAMGSSGVGCKPRQAFNLGSVCSPRKQEPSSLLSVVK